jgi:hypothetical protein
MKKKYINCNDDSHPITIPNNQGVVNIYQQKAGNALESHIKSEYSNMGSVATKALHNNATEFSLILKKIAQNLTIEELQKLDEPKVMIALHDALKAAAQENSGNIHNLLGQLVKDRLKISNDSIVDLTVHEAIRVVPKLDENLIKTLAIGFYFLDTKSMHMGCEESLYQELARVIEISKGLNVSDAKLKYLEGISCGRVSVFAQHNLTEFLLQKYRQLFIKPLSEEHIQEIQNILGTSFKMNLNNPKMLRILGLSLFEENSNISSSILQEITKAHNMLKMLPNNHLDKLKKLYIANRMHAQECSMLIKDNVPGYVAFESLWNSTKLSSFTLTAIGVAIGRAYLEQNGLGNFNIHFWIN